MVVRLGQNLLQSHFLVAGQRPVSAATAARKPPQTDCSQKDEERRRALFASIVAIGAQAWLTGTDENVFAPLGAAAQFFRVEDATVTPW